MAQPKTTKKLSIIVPAYNEQGRIENVLKVLCTYKNALEIIVIDDGSTDGTEKSVKQFKNIRYIKNEHNIGKGLSMDKAVNLAKSQYIFFCDADVTGLTHNVIDEISKPVFDGEVDMFIAMRNRKMFYLHQIVVVMPLIGGERVITKQLWNKVPAYYKHNFKIEAALNFYARHYGNGFNYKIFRDMSQVIKEKKYGLRSGFKQRMAMNYDVILAQLKLRLLEIPSSGKTRRFLNIITLQSSLGLIIGGLFIYAAAYGPYSFVNTIFAEELIEDPGSPFINWLLKLASLTANSTVAIIGLLLFAANLMTLAWALKKLGTLMIDFRLRAASNKTTD